MRTARAMFAARRGVKQYFTKWGAGAPPAIGRRNRDGIKCWREEGYAGPWHKIDKRTKRSAPHFS
jgi:hypothetical protein